MAGPWKPEEFEDTYNEDLMQRIEEKVKRGETKVLTKPEGETGEPRSAQVIDLMELLKQSIDKTDGRGARPRSGAASARRRSPKVTRCAEGTRAQGAQAAAHTRRRRKQAGRATQARLSLRASRFRQRRADARAEVAATRCGSSGMARAPATSRARRRKRPPCR